jgi:NADH-quinone oxidoreductase subunit L
MSDVKSTNKFERSTYDPTHGLEEEEAHHVHQTHILGAILSIIIAFSGVGLAYLTYIAKKMDPSIWMNRFTNWYDALKNKYYMDWFYQEVLINKVLLPMNRAIAFFDMGIYDRYAVDGVEKVNRVLFTGAKWFDNLVIDTSLVDGSGASVKLMNVILRTIQSGRIQFYFIIIVVVLASYIWTLNIH